MAFCAVAWSAPCTPGTRALKLQTKENPLVRPWLSEAWAVTVDDEPLLGMPEMCPAGLADRPGGSPVTVHV